MIIKERMKKLIREEKGSTLITVIVVIGFVTILTSIILGSSLANYRMKAIDRRAKDDFYFTEKALNDIYTGIGQEISVIAANAYDAAFSHVGVKVSDGGGSYIDVTTVQKAEAYYKQKFFEDVASWASANANRAKFQSYIVDSSSDGKESYVMGVGSPPVVEDNAETPITDPTLYGSTAACVRIKDINVVCTDTNRDYKGEVITDIVITIPMMGFFDNNVDISDYAIIANEGIETEGDLTVADGNVYAGLGKNALNVVSGGLNINSGKTEFDGNYLISKGDITVGSSGKNASFKAGYNRSTRPNIWCDSITTAENAVTPSIAVKANTFALNDLELNALGSNAKFEGTYYGYDEGFLASSETTDGMLIDKAKEHSDSSAIIINGDQCTLDMRGLSTLMLMGKAYIETTDGSEISTAEALALRTNQQLYLVPADFLDCPNPAAGEKTEAAWNCNISDKWFGYRYLKKKEDGKPKIKTITIGSGEAAVSYAFLEFDDAGDYDLTSIGGTAHNKARSAFIFEIMRGVDTIAPGETSPVQPTQSQLKTRISNSLANYDSFRLQECVVNNSADANIYSVNALVNYVVGDSGYSGINDVTRIGTPSEIIAVKNTAAMDRYVGYPQNLFRRYQWLCTMLNANEDTPLSVTINPVPTGARGVRQIDETSSWKADSDYPYKYFIKDAVWSDLSDSTKIPTSSFGQCIYDANPVLSENFKGVVIATGDITVNSGVSVDGLLIARGKIIFRGANTVKSDRALLQKRIAKEIELNKEDGKYCQDYFISYLDSGVGTLLYGTTSPEGASKKATEERTDYTEYVFFENWKKGGR